MAFFMNVGRRLNAKIVPLSLLTHSAPGGCDVDEAEGTPEEHTLFSLADAHEKCTGTQALVQSNIAEVMHSTEVAERATGDEFIRRSILYLVKSIEDEESESPGETQEELPTFLDQAG